MAAVATCTLTGDLSTLVVGLPLQRRLVRAYLESNAGDQPIIDSNDSGAVHLGAVPLALDSDAHFSRAGVIRSDASGINIAGGTLQYQVVVHYDDPGSGRSMSWDSGWFTLTADSDLKDVAGGEIDVPPEWRTAFRTDMEGLRDESLDAAANADSSADLAAASADEAAANANGFTGGTATALAPGATPTVEITGTAPDRQINLGIPAGLADDASMTAVAANPTSAFAIQQSASNGAQMSDNTSPVRVVADDLFAPVVGSSEYMRAVDAQPRVTAVDLLGSDFATQSSGSSGWSNLNGMRYMLAGHSANNLWDAQFVIPDWATTVNAKLYWFALTAAGTGQASFRVAVKGSRRDGGGTIQSPAQPASGDIAVNLPASANVIQAPLAFGPWTGLDPLHIFTVRVGRLGAVAGDTNTDVDTGIVGVELVFS